MVSAVDRTERNFVVINILMCGNFLANWNAEQAQKECSSTGSLIVEFIPGEDSIFNAMIRFSFETREVPLRIFKSHGRVCFLVYRVKFNI